MRWRALASAMPDPSLRRAAMENKGLNVFNTAYVLAKPSTGESVPSGCTFCVQ